MHVRIRDVSVPWTFTNASANASAAAATLFV
jgi:hypothetical protein